MKRLFFFLFLVAGTALAQVAPITQYKYAEGQPTWSDTMPAACTAVAAYSTSTLAGCNGASGAYFGQWSVTESPNPPGVVSCKMRLTRTSCSDGSTISPIDYVWNAPLTQQGCPTGTTFQNGSCVSSDCPAAGTDAGTFNITSGWANGPDLSARIQVKVIPDGAAVPGGLPMSHNGCGMTVGSVQACWQSGVPASTGLYRISCDIAYKYTGAKVAPSATVPDSAAPPSSAPPCPSGNVGTVNDKPVCLDSTESTPNNTSPAPRPGVNPVPGKTPEGGSAQAPSVDPVTGAGSSSPPGTGGTVANSGGGGGGGSVNVTMAPLPTDYTRESTQQDIRAILNGQGVEMADQSARVAQATEQSTTDLENMRTEVQNGIGADKDRFFSWVWTPPIGNCSPFVGTVRGYDISWDLCPTIANIRDVLGWLLALFSAMTVYGQLFKRYD